MGSTSIPVRKSFQALGYDRLYLLTSERFSAEVDEVKQLLGGFNVEVHPVMVSGFDFQEIVSSIYRIYEGEKGKDVQFSMNITGGTNLMAAAACSCAFFIGATIYYVLMGDGPVKEQVVTIPTPKTPDLGSLKPETREILRYILSETESGHTVTTGLLMGRFGRTKQSVNYQVNILRSEGLIENGIRLKDGGKIDKRARSLVLTPQGRLIASWI